MRAIARSVRLVVLGASLGALIGRLAEPGGRARATPRASASANDKCPDSGTADEARAAPTATGTRIGQQLDRGDGARLPPAVHPSPTPAADAELLEGQGPPQPRGPGRTGAALVALGGSAGTAGLEEAKPWERAPETSLSHSLRALAALCVFGLSALIVWHIVSKLLRYGTDGLGVFYTLTVTTYVFSRFVFAAIYRPPRERGLEPSVAIVVPSYNEGEAVARTIHSCLGLDYPAEKLELVVINDGSTDDTWEQMLAAASLYPEGRIRCVDLGSNQGKRAAMAAGIRATSAEVLVFVDSDSMPAPRAVRKIVQGLSDPKVGAISGLTHVRNAEANLLTRMQAARYYISFQLLKAAESVVSAVSCCSGCFAAYRRSAVLDVLEQWEHQVYLGVECTYGDDRALTNMILRKGWKAIYDAEAEAWTDAPERYPKFFRQQLRWKKSWAREGPILAAHLWRTRPLAFPAALAATLCGLLSPFVVVWNVVVQPLRIDLLPTFYLLCLYLMSITYALMYRALRSDGVWKHGIAATFFYVSFSLQLVWAILRIRDGKWGTRGEPPSCGEDGEGDAAPDGYGAVVAV
jgi:hyaluronan synthase